jgi:hypothetical protein
LKVTVLLDNIIFIIIILRHVKLANAQLFSKQVSATLFKYKVYDDYFYMIPPVVSSDSLNVTFNVTTRTVTGELRVLLLMLPFVVSSKSLNVTFNVTIRTVTRESRVLLLMLPFVVSSDSLNDTFNVTTRTVTREVLNDTFNVTIRRIKQDIKCYF